MVVGSQGALDAFRELLVGLPAEFPAAVVFDLHRRSDAGGFTQRLLSTHSPLPLLPAREWAPLEPGTVYVAPADRQLYLSNGGCLRFGPPGLPGKGHPFADELLGSAAAALGPRVVAVVLSGRLQAGADGVRAVKHAGGRVLVQAPSTADAPGMPSAALATGCADFALAPAGLAQALTALCAAPGGAELFRVRLNAAARA